MTNRLPEGLLRANEALSESIRSTEHIDAQTLRSLWHVFQVNARFIDDGQARRMENFFWRIWSNRNIHTSVTTNNLGRLATTFAQGGDQVAFNRTARPDPVIPSEISPRSTPSHVQHEVSSSASSSNVSPSHLSSVEATGPHPSPSPAQATAPPGSSMVSQSLPPPILKKSRSSSDQETGSERYEISTGNLRVAQSSSVRGETSVSNQALTFLHPEDRLSSGSSNRKKSVSSHAAGAGSKSKARPGMQRKRSSQGTVPTRKLATSPRMRAQRDTSEQSDASSRAGPNQRPRFSIGASTAETASTFALPSSSWQDIESPPRFHENKQAAFTQPSSWLVESNFRDRFEEQKKRAASHTNLTSLNRTTSSVRFIEELPERSKGQQRYSEVDTHGNIIRSLLQSAASSERPEELVNQEDIAVDDSGESPLILPQSKSQLSLLIDKERRSSSGTLGSQFATPPPEGGLSSRPSTRAEDDEGDYLTLGMGVGQARYRTNNKGKGKEKEADEGKGKQKATENYRFDETPDRYDSPEPDRMW